jgi:hypothetical protein
MTRTKDDTGGIIFWLRNRDKTQGGSRKLFSPGPEPSGFEVKALGVQALIW